MSKRVPVRLRAASQTRCLSRLRGTAVKSTNAIANSENRGREDAEYFRAYSDIEIHEVMLKDAVRTNA